MDITKENIIGELVARDYRTASIFKKHRIDFCCQGNKTIDEACQKKGLDAKVVVGELNEVNNKSSEKVDDYQSWPLDLLIDYIEKKHHRYVEEKISEIKPYLDKVTRVHGAHHPELLEINELFSGSAAELTQHMKKEELILFPFIKKMVEANQKGEMIEQPPFGTVDNPIQMMRHEHDNEGERFRQIAQLSDNYIPPADACNTYRVTYALLKEFEEDLHLHIHLENNILFPKSLELESVNK
ncbi:MAG: iron-sulfur cluster repair di-iron protein [Flavobacteriales bacterium]|nr:iron-sulfur cluster repair di-iron protein [Flavobacteriales bacterium]